jgi:hypothetical protein
MWVHTGKGPKRRQEKRNFGKGLVGQFLCPLPFLGGMLNVLDIARDPLIMLMSSTRRIIYAIDVMLSLSLGRSPMGLMDE